jgi:carbon-monoxide dehydrogenase large subunit
MNMHADANQLATMKFAVGQPVTRKEDPTLLRGQGRYTDDINLPGQAYCVMVRSQYAHGIIKGIDTSAAKQMPGVLGVWTGVDLDAAGFGPLKTMMILPNRDGTPMKTPTRHSLATDKVRFVGDPVAFVVAETMAQAKDAAEAVEVDIDPLPAVTDARAAAEPGAPLVFDDVPSNICLDFHAGDAEKVAEAFAGRRMSRACHWSAIESSSAPWSRARRSATTIPRPTAIPSAPATRARSA